MNRLLFISISIVAFIGCSLFEDDAPKDPRDYTWTIDTLHVKGNSQTIMFKVWGSSGNDVYTIGHSSRTGDMWHYNGTKWSPIPIVDLDGGPIPTTPYQLKSVYGFSRHNVWLVGRKNIRKRYPTGGYYYSNNHAFILHYNGLQWKELEAKGIEGLLSINGSSSTNLWFGTNRGNIYSYNGFEFTHYKSPVDTPAINRQWVEDIQVDQKGKTFVLLGNNLTRFANETRTHLLEYDGEWIVKDTVTYARTQMWLSPQGNLYTGGYKLRKYNGHDWLIDSSFPKDHVVNAIYGLNENHIFVVGVEYKNDHFFSQLYYYNGKDWTGILPKKFKDVIFLDVWADKNSVFVIGYTNSAYPEKTIVIKGK